MTEESKASEHLRVIRTLMERATIYRAISAPTALVGGVLASGLAGWNWFSAFPLPFLASWLTVLTLTLAANTIFLWRDNTRAGHFLLSTGLRLAIRAVLPLLITAGVFSFPSIFVESSFPILALLWVTFYGLALLATEQFAPRSLVWLGRAFLLAGLLLLLLAFLHFPPPAGPHRANAIMGLTFGLFHLLYAAATWPRRAAVDPVG